MQGAGAAFTQSAEAWMPTYAVLGVHPSGYANPKWTNARQGLIVVITGSGAILRPWTRFPGQTSSTQGSTRILVDAQGGFTWQRRTGKTVYVTILSQDGTVVSNRLILRTN